MNLPVIFSKAATALKGVCGSGALVLRKNADKIFIGLGIVGFGVAVGETIAATNKTNDILDQKEKIEEDYVMTEEGRKKLLRGTRAKLIWTWVPVLGTFVASVIFIGKGYAIINGRYVAAASAYEALDAFTKRYRENVIEEFGKETDWRLAHEMKQEDYDAMKAEQRENQLIEEENAGKKGKKKRPKTRYAQERKFLLDPDSSIYWKRYWTPDQFLDWIQHVKNELNDKLHSDGYLLENDALKRFGMKPTSEGAIVGWLDRKGTEPSVYVSVGLDEMPEEELRRILATTRNEDLRFWLDFNSQGIIYHMIDNAVVD